MDKTKWFQPFIDFKNGQKTECTDTFFAIIGRDYDEDLLSRALAYTIENDTDLLKKLCDKYLKEKLNENVTEADEITDVVVRCEKRMYEGRADIFAEFKVGKEKYTLTIENKIREWEHNTKHNGKDILQTKVYHEYVADKYKDAINIFYYLKPIWNGSEPSSQYFLMISYEELLKFMNRETDNVYICDFIKHIENYMTEEKYMSKFDEKDKNAVESYEKARAGLTKYFQQYKTIKEEVTESVIRKFENKISNWETDSKTKYKYEKISWQSESSSSFRICKPEWYKQDVCYFFVEILFNPILKKTCYQRTVRIYKNNNEVKDKIKNEIQCEKEDKEWIVIKNETYPVGNWYKPVDEYQNEVYEKLKSFLVSMDEEFNKVKDKI